MGAAESGEESRGLVLLEVVDLGVPQDFALGVVRRALEEDIEAPGVLGRDLGDTAEILVDTLIVSTSGCWAKNSDTKKM